MKKYIVTKMAALTVMPGSVVIVSENQYNAAKAFLEPAEQDPEKAARTAAKKTGK